MVMEVVGLRTRLKYVCGANTSTQRNNVILQTKRPSLLAIVAGDIMKRYLHMWNTWQDGVFHQGGSAASTIEFLPDKIMGGDDHKDPKNTRSLNI
jgi:hypothetical protein